MWIKRVVPLVARRVDAGWSGRVIGRGATPAGAIVAIQDVTDELRKEQELKIKTAMIQEIHHRVKNNLQTIAALLRLQARRTDIARGGRSAARDASAASSRSRSCTSS